MSAALTTQSTQSETAAAEVRPVQLTPILYGPPACFQPGYGRNTLFFVWNAGLIGIEYALSGAAIFKLLKKHLPPVIISLLVTSTALPVAHWFTNDYVRTDFFHDGQLGWPIIIRLDE